nr:VOC family protein [Sphingomonas sp. Y57]
MSRITPCLWFKDQAEEAARFYCSILPDSRVDAVHRATVDSPGPKVGDVLLVEFTLAGQKFQALNGGMDAEYGLAVSMSFAARDQAELDRVWDGLLAGGAAQQCGWLADRYGLHWQIVPENMGKILADPAKSRAAMAEVFKMVKIDIATLEKAVANA